MKQLLLAVAHRRWLVVAVGGTLFALADIALGLLGTWEDWILLAIDAPLGAVGWVGWRKTRPTHPRPDYARIALLEQELLGIKPEPGTFLAATQALTEAFTPRGIRRDRSPVFVAEQRPQPPPGPGAGSPIRKAVEQHRRDMETLREIRADMDRVSEEITKRLGPR